MSDLLKRSVSRRTMLKGVAATAAAAALTACQPKVVEVTKLVEKVVKETVVVEKEVVKPDAELKLHFITQLWNWQKLNMATATDQYNMNNRGKVRVDVDPVPDGWTTKVVQMIKDDELLWDGMLRVMNSSGEVSDYRRMGIIQPWDEYINASAEPWAGKFWDEILPYIRDSFSDEGKLWGLPWDIELFCRVYRKEWWDALGEGTVPAETLADFEMQLLELKKIFPDKVPFGMRHWGLTPDQHMLMQLWTDDLFVQEEGLGSFFDVRGDAYKQYLSLIKHWFDVGIMTDDSWGPGQNELSKKGMLLCSQSGAAWMQAQEHKIYGREQIVATTNFVINKGDQPKTHTFGNAAVLFKGAENPQEITDWLLWMVDPTIEKVANHSFHKGDLNYYHLPAYKSIYENIIPTNADWAWMEKMLPMVNASVAMPPDVHLLIFHSISTPWEEKFIHGECSLEECVEGIYEEERDTVGKFIAGQIGVREHR